MCCALPSFTSRLVVLHWKFELNLIPYGGSKQMHCTLPRSPSRSADEAITCNESPRIIRFDQF